MKTLPRRRPIQFTNRPRANKTALLDAVGS
jgi:hypothetical protein